VDFVATTIRVRCPAVLRRASFALVLTAAVVLSGAPLASAGAHVTAPRTEKKVIVDLFGDSLATQAANYLDADLNPYFAVLHAYTFGGTALCDWVYPHMATNGSTLSLNDSPGAILDLTTKDAPTIAILQFVGNRTTSCIDTEPFSLAGFLANYEYCLNAAIHHLLGIGTRHIIIDAGPPSSTVIEGQTQLRALDKSDVESFHDHNIVYAGGADASVLAKGQFAWDLPCLPVETATGLCTGPVIHDIATNVVRSSDGVHFCPDTRGVNGLIPFYCPVYSSGAYRFALAFATLVWALDPASEPRLIPVISSLSPDVGPADGGTLVTINGYHLATVRTVQFVELFVPIVNGVELQGGAPIVVIVDATALADQSDSSVTVTAPANMTTDRGHSVNVFVRVLAAHAESVIGLTSDEFYPTSSEPSS
jgi:hypothetical protein